MSDEPKPVPYEQLTTAEKIARMESSYRILLDASLKAYKHGSSHLYDKPLEACQTALTELRKEVKP